MRRRSALALLLVVAGCSSPPPPPRDDLSMLARISELDTKLHDEEKARENLLLRIAALEATVGRKPRPDDDVGARVAAIESKLGALEDKVGFLELARSVAERDAARAKEDADKVTIVDHKAAKERSSAPAPGEVVRAIAAVSGDTFSFVRDGKLDLARLAGVEAPGRDDEDGFKKAQDRLEALLAEGELRFEYPAGVPDTDGRALAVYVVVKKKDGAAESINEVLLREGLAFARGEHGRREAFEKLSEDAKKAKKGLFSR